MTEADVVQAVLRDPLRERIVRKVAELELPDAWIAGGFVRNAFWDYLYGAEGPTPINDVDVIYYKDLDAYGLPESDLCALIAGNEPNAVWEEEERATRFLSEAFPDIEFEVKNQARMHMSSARLEKREQYRGITDAVADWVETATGTGIRFIPPDSFEILSAHGLADLFDGVVRPSSSELRERARSRAEKKGWFSRWPKLRFEEPL